LGTEVPLIPAGEVVDSDAEVAIIVAKGIVQVTLV
jgi:hypothetical protein